MDLEEMKGKAIAPEALLDFLLYYASTQMSVGVQTARIVRNANRIAEAYGYKITVMIFQRNLSISITSHLGNSTRTYPIPLTAMTHHSVLPINFRLNSELTRLSWYVDKHKPRLEELQEKYNGILALPKRSLLLKTIFISSANSSFCYLGNGDWQAILLVFFATCFGFLTKEFLMKQKAYHYFTVIAAAFVTSFIIGLGGTVFELTATPQAALIASVLYLIPGIPFINSIMDFFDGFMLNGLSRFANAVFIVASLSIGLSLTLITLNITL